MYQCRICSDPISPFFDFGQMPIGNAFLDEQEFGTEYFYHMQVGVCASCNTLQLLDVPDPTKMFHDHYAYFASTSDYMVNHFRDMAGQLMKGYLPDENPFVVEIGCNDGITLQNFAGAGIPHLGVDPSSNVIEAARQKGIRGLVEFFHRESAENIASEFGHADIIIATNTMHHIENMNSVVAGIAHLLKPTGIFVQEDPYMGDMIGGLAYDQLYAEHMYIWSITSLNNAFRPYGMEIFDAEHNDFHGGCMRYYLCKKSAHGKTRRLLDAIAKETALGLGDSDTYNRFRDACEDSRLRLRSQISRLRSEGKRIVGYGATAKSATIINFCGLTVDDIEFISDTTPAKQHKFTPGAHIPVKPHEEFVRDYPDYAVLFAWNHFSEINAKEPEFREHGGKWIIPIGPIDIL